MDQAKVCILLSVLYVYHGHREWACQTTKITPHNWKMKLHHLHCHPELLLYTRDCNPYKFHTFWGAICDCILENRPYGHKYWNPFYACRWMPNSCTTQRHHALENSRPGLLLQAAFLRRCKTARVHFVACVAPEGH